MTGGTINDITKLKFFTDRGYEIPMLKSYILTWEIIPGDSVSNYIRTAPYGYFIGDVDTSDTTNIKIKSDTLLAGVIESGEVFARYAETAGYDDNGFKVFAYDSDSYKDIYEYLWNILFADDNTLRVSINIQDTKYTNSYHVKDIFSNSAPKLLNYKDYVTINTVYTGTNNSDSKEYYKVFGVKQFTEFTPVSETDNTPFIQYALETNVPNLGYYFPFVRYSGDFYQETISSKFIAANTMVILEEGEDEDGNIIYEKPFIATTSGYSLVFQPSSTSEIKIISSDSEYNIEYISEAAFSLADPETSSYITPFTFAFGFQAETEGAYQNLLGIYIRCLDNTDIVFFAGALSIKTQVEGEDERFRTLLGNFGVPDPIDYSNLFAEADYLELGKDYKLINKKSKELMLTYDQIFSYVGTYKALYKAIKFLGYTDIIFKEWYTLKDSNDKETDIAVQVFDSSTGSMLKQKLADYGVSIEDFKNYNKINRISMIYHLNEQDDENYEEMEMWLSHYNKSTGEIEHDDNVITKMSEVPLTKIIQEYRTDEILAKLYGVKHWLEYNIIGVGAYISEITGEGLYFGWEKSQIYGTEHNMSDYSSEQYYTPDVKCVLPFVQSQGKIACTLTELNDSVKICEYDNVPFDAFIRYQVPITMKSTDDIVMDDSTIAISNTVEAPVLGDEFEFVLTNNPTSGTLYEWTSKDTSSQIHIVDGEIKLLFEEYTEAKIDPENLPIITLENANIHKCYGSWKNNIEWVIKETIDQSTGNVKYKVKNVNEAKNDNYAIYRDDYVILKPTASASLKYSENNKWDLPMFIIKGYTWDFKSYDIKDQEKYNAYYHIDPTKEYILEILKGDMLFKEVGNVGSQLSFTTDAKYLEQGIGIQYTYHTERKPFTIINYNQIQKDTSDSSFDYTTLENTIITNVSTATAQMNQALVDDLSNFITSEKVKNNVAKNEAENYFKSEEYLSDYQAFLDYKKSQVVKQAMYNDYQEIYTNNYTFNRCIDADVNRLGNYNIMVRAYDKFNNIFTNKYDKTANVTAKPIAIDTYIQQEKSNNVSTFYQYNKSGIEVTSDTINELLYYADEKPLYPKNYRIYDFDYDISTHDIKFDNLSYAIDTAKTDDYLYLENLSERCTGIEITQSGDTYTTKLYMLDENPGRVKLYNPSTYINICVYDTVEHRDVINVGPYLVTSSYLHTADQDESISDESYLIINDGNFKQLKKYINSTQRYKTYILNSTQYIISNLNVTEDTSNKLTTISLGLTYQVFNLEDVVKVRYSKAVTVGDDSGTIINETAYRIQDVSIVKTGNTVNNIYYIIDGLINKDLLNDSDVICYLMYANQNSVHYTTRVLCDAAESTYTIGNDIYMLYDKFKFNTKQLFLSNYMDDTYAGYITDYDHINLEKVWYDMSNVYDANNMELFYYHNFPITVKQGKYMTFTSHDDYNVFTPGYHVEWTWYNQAYDDIDNWEHVTYTLYNKFKKSVIFRSVNKNLTIAPNLLGTQDIQLTCIDKYGNRLVNNGGGLLFVEENPNYKPTFILNNNLMTFLKLESVYGKAEVNYDEDNEEFTVQLSELSPAITGLIENGENIYLTITAKNAQNLQMHGSYLYRKSSDEYFEKTWQNESVNHTVRKGPAVLVNAIRPADSYALKITRTNSDGTFKVSLLDIFQDIPRDIKHQFEHYYSNNKESMLTTEDGGTGEHSEMFIDFKFILMDDRGRKYSLSTPWQQASTKTGVWKYSHYNYAYLN